MLEPVRTQIPALVDSLRNLSRRRNGSLRAVSLAIPSNGVAEWVRTELARELARAGYAGVEIVLVVRGDDFRILSAEFDHPTVR